MSSWLARPPEQWLAKASQVMPAWLSLLLVILIGHQLGSLAWMLYPVSGDIVWSPPQQTTPLTNAGAATPSGADYGDISDAHLFGRADAEPEAVAEEIVDAPDTRLNLTLRAAVSDNENEFAHAIISDGGGKEKVYFIKDSVPGGATLHQIFPDRVILNRGGTLEALRLPREFRPAPASRTVVTAPAAPRSAAPTAQQLITENAATLTEIIRPQPFMPNGQMRGYRLYPGRNRQQFSALGLRPGDLVTEINGMPLTNPADGMNIFASLGDSSQVNVTIERGGQPQTLVLDTRHLDGSGGATR